MSRPDIWPKKAADFMPHSGLMCVIDDLLSAGGGKAEASVVIRPGSPFLREDGTVDETVFVEMIAQTIAAGNGHELSDEKLKTRQGYLLGIKNVKITGTARAGDTLRIKAHKYAEFGDFGIIEGAVFRGEEILASGEIKVFQSFDGKPSEIVP
jgi:3-hydroxyacyl-[acyl-carrier-protein] dehydratase